jgi:diguanylate cyclase (GGDEF)-like protein
VVVLDIDDLKPINDKFGHAAGDAAIRAVAKAIRGVIRPDDLLFRWGGDEFLAILLGLSASEARPRFERINVALKQVALRGIEPAPDLHVSFGIAPFELATALDEAIEQADVEMYSLKQAYKAARSKMGAGTSR